MAIAYAVTSGSYFDYRVHRVFSTRARAEAWIGGLSDSYEIEEMPLDDDSGAPVAQLMGAIDVATARVELLATEEVWPPTSPASRSWGVTALIRSARAKSYSCPGRSTSTSR